MTIFLVTLVIILSVVVACLVATVSFLQGWCDMWEEKYRVLVATLRDNEEWLSEPVKLALDKIGEIL